MQRMFRFAAMVLLAAGSAYAQSMPAGDSVCEVTVSKPKAGMAKAFEEGRKQHNNFHRTEKTKENIAVWNVITGPATGQYTTTVCGLTWKSMDADPAQTTRDEADVARTMGASGESMRSYYVLRPDMSFTQGPGTGVPKMLSVVHYYLKPEGVPGFMEAVKRIQEAMRKTNYPTHPSRWYVLANGGEGPHFVLVTDRNSWADMEPPQKSMQAMLDEAYGANDKSLADLRSTFRYTVSEILEYRGDLSFVPGK